MAPVDFATGHAAVTDWGKILLIYEADTHHSHRHNDDNHYSNNNHNHTDC